VSRVNRCSTLSASSFIVDKTTANNAFDCRARPRLAPMRINININHFFFPVALYKPKQSDTFHKAVYHKQWF
jgi:hypothetical protein